MTLHGAACGAAALAASLGAAHRQGTLAAEARTRFSGTTVRDFQVWVPADTLTEDVCDALSVYAGGARYARSSIEARCPAAFFGVRRCVYVEWSAAAITVRPESGRACAVLIG